MSANSDSTASRRADSAYASIVAYISGVARGSGAVIDLTGEHYDRIVMNLDNPDEAIAGLP